MDILVSPDYIFLHGTKQQVYNMKQELHDMLLKSAEADKAKAILTLKLLSESSVGIGDHSTGDYYNNAEEALSKLCDANDRIETLTSLNL